MQGRFFGLWLFSKRRMSVAFALRAKRKFPFWILWKTAKATARIGATLGTAVYAQNPQPLRLIAPIDNSNFFASAVGVVCRWRERFFVATKKRGRAQIV